LDIRGTSTPGNGGTMSSTKNTARLHLRDGALLEFMPGDRGPWRRGIVRELPEGRWVVEEIGRGQRFVLDGSLRYRTVDGAPIHVLKGRPWWASEVGEA